MKKHPISLGLLGAITGLTATAGSNHALAQESLERAMLEEVVITARKREESMQEVPVAVTSLSGDEMIKRGIADFDELSIGNPNVRISPGAGGGAISSTVMIRGNIQNSSTVQIDPSVGTYLDGFILTRTFAVSASMVDLASVQTLRGPQGTLFGRNTTGGALLLTTEDPSIEDGVTGWARAEGGEEGTLGYGGAINLPLGDSLAARVVGNHSELDDYLSYKDGGVPGTEAVDLGKLNTDTVRTKLLWDASDNTTVLLSYEYGKVDGTAPEVLSNNKANFNGDPNIGGVYTIGPNTLTTPIIESEFAQRQKATSDIYLLTATHETSWGEVKFITGQRDLDVKSNLSLPPGLGWARQDKPDLKNYTAELQVNGGFLDDRLEVTSGIYYFNENTTEDQTIYSFTNLQPPLNPVLIETYAETKIESSSLYAQGTWSFSDSTRMTLGGRYTDDTRDTKGTRSAVGALQWDDSNNETSYLVSVDHFFTEDIMAYASTGTGYRSAGANLSPDPSKPGSWGSFKPEKVTNYETGLKSDWLDGALRVNGAVFYQDYKDYQYTAVVTGADGIPLRSALTNDAKIQGGELEVTALLPLNFTLSLDYGYTDAELDGGPADGDKLPNVPENTYAVTLGWDTETDFGNVDLRFVYDYRDKSYGQVGEEEFSTTDDRGIIKVSATLQTDNWTFMAYVENLTDEAYQNSGLTSGDPADLRSISLANLGRPRIAGLRVTYDF